MEQNQQYGKDSGTAPLEDHVRGLILKDGEPAADASNSQGPSKGTQTKQGKKRPNQAQRRQMNAELSIPVDTRPNFQQHSHRPYQNQQFDHRYQPQAQPQQPQALPPHFPAQQGYNHSLPAAPEPHSRPHGRGFHAHGAPFHSQSQYARGFSPAPHPAHYQGWRQRPQPDTNSFPRGVTTVSPDAFPPRDIRGAHQGLYSPGGPRRYVARPEDIIKQSALLDHLCHVVVSGAEIEHGEIVEKEQFRHYVEAICRGVIAHHEAAVDPDSQFQPNSVQLQCFGSLASGFATKAADMDLGLISPQSKTAPDSGDSRIPRLVEKALLEAGFGARLLTRTRVPIIKLCEKPPTQLRTALMEAREKWEHEEENGVDDQGPVQEPISTENPPAKPIPSATEHRASDDQPAFEADIPYEEKLVVLKQSTNQTLFHYYGHALKLLRQVNGRDITQSNLTDFRQSDFKILDDVCNAFITGLNDEPLRTRIEAYPSFHAGLNTTLPNYRSLVGVLRMVEGERLVMLWEAKAIAEGYENEEEVAALVRRWKELHTSKTFGTNPTSFYKEIVAITERLRQTPSVQILQLQQDQFESPTDYYQRALRLGGETRGSKFVERYVSGIRGEEMREQVRFFVESHSDQPLKAVARRHKSLVLAHEYEKAVEKNLYEPEHVPLIVEYCSLLRSQMVEAPSRGNGPAELVVPTADKSAALLSTIKDLPNPSTLAPNKPRDPYHDSLEFPKNGIGVQCDINFSAQLALINTALLRCYSHTDPRVRPLVLFVKHWAKIRGINTPYRGTLSSYGYVLMMLHYLVNVVEPFICPNLQLLAPPDSMPSRDSVEGAAMCQGYNVHFWRDEQEIMRLSREGLLNQNRDSPGQLLRGFFEYYAQNGYMSTINKKGFDWGRDVLSLRTHGGLLSKQDKGWTGAKTEIQVQQPNGNQSPEATARVPAVNVSPQKDPTAGASGDSVNKPKEVKEVRHRYLFAVEDPFELDHNVARTVTHNGIVSIRDEFRRAWRIIKSASKTGHVAEDLLEDAKAHSDELSKKQFAELLEEIHGSPSVVG